MKKHQLFAAALCLSLLMFSGCTGGKTNGDAVVSLPESSQSREGSGSGASEPPEKPKEEADFLMLMSDDVPADLEPEQLCRAAVNYCEASTGHRPGVVRIDSVEEEGVTLQLYDDMGDHTATCAWYCIQPGTMEGYDVITGEEIAFYSYMQETPAKA